jgi:hypothetical protein
MKLLGRGFSTDEGTSIRLTTLTVKNLASQDHKTTSGRCLLDAYRTMNHLHSVISSLY